MYVFTLTAALALLALVVPLDRAHAADSDTDARVVEYWRTYQARHPRTFDYLLSKHPELSDHIAGTVPASRPSLRPAARNAAPSRPRVATRPIRTFALGSPVMVPHDRFGYVWVPAELTTTTTSTTATSAFARSPLIDIEPLIRVQPLRQPRSTEAAAGVPALGAPIDTAAASGSAFDPGPGLTSVASLPSGSEIPPVDPPGGTPPGGTPPGGTPPGGGPPGGGGHPGGGIGSLANNGVGNGEDGQPRGNPPINDGPGTFPGSPGSAGGTPGNNPNIGGNPNPGGNPNAFGGKP